MDDNQAEKYIEAMKTLQENYMEFRTTNQYYYEDGMYIWGFTSGLMQTIFNDLDDNDYKEEEVVSVTGGLIIPEEMAFGDGYTSAWELCDTISGDLLAAYTTVATMNEGIKPELIKELELENEASYESSILFIQDISAINENHLSLFLNLFDTFKEGLPARYCRLAMVLLNLEKESNCVKTYLQCGWKLKAVDGSAAIAYKRI